MYTGARSNVVFQAGDKIFIRARPGACESLWDRVLLKTSCPIENVIFFVDNDTYWRQIGSDIGGV